AHTTWFGRILILIVAILHTKHCVSFRACALVLQCFSMILLTLGMLDPTSPLPITLNTVIQRLDLCDRFVIYPVCIHCQRVYPTDTLVNALCSECDNCLFKPVSNKLYRMVTGHKPQPPPPACAAPIHLPSSLLIDFLASAENENACESWRHRTTKPGELHDISDGQVWQNAQGTDGKSFFSKTDSFDELHISVTMSLDWYVHTIWFGRKMSVYRPSHSSGVLSLCVSNLLRALRYRVENLLVAFMTPSPHEPTGSQLQNYLKFIVDDLLKLYNDGVIYHTPAYPQGIICDHPAMCKMCGFADHGHNEAPCPKCKVKKDSLFSDESLRNGIIKTQWYNQWIQGSALRASTETRVRELDIIHKFLSMVRISKFFNLRNEYKFAATTAWPIIIPVVWDAFVTEAENEHQTSLKSFTKRQAQFMKDWKAWQERQEAPPSTSKGKGKKGKKGTDDDKEPKPLKMPKVRMQREEPVNFLRLSAALKIFCGSSIKLEMLPRAEELLQAYLFGYKQIYGPESMKPNFHWAVHLATQIRDYGPVYNFWAFLSERLNKVLKSSNSNNWTGGQIEISMMREFAHGSRLDSLVSSIELWSRCYTTHFSRLVQSFPLLKTLSSRRFWSRSLVKVRKPLVPLKMQQLRTVGSSSNIYKLTKHF
ncbi:hypothetical protein BDN67DRAFT_914663, partial [Paxillus ammoniavirescens]